MTKSGHLARRGKAARKAAWPAARPTASTQVRDMLGIFACH